jgi:hypothetical protein
MNLLFLILYSPMHSIKINQPKQFLDRKIPDPPCPLNHPAFSAFHQQNTLAIIAKFKKLKQTSHGRAARAVSPELRIFCTPALDHGWLATAA